MSSDDDGLTQDERTRGERLFLFEAAAVAAASRLSGAPILSALLKTIDARPRYVSLLMSATFLGGLTQLLAPGLFERFRSRKPVCVAAFAVARAARFGLVFLPMLLFTALAPRYVYFHFAVLFTMGAFGSIGMIGRMSWVSDLVPERELGDFWAKRQSISRVLMILIPILAGGAVSVWKQHHRGLAEELPVFQTLFLVGGICGIGSWVCFVLAPEPPFRPDPAHTSFFKSLQNAFRDRAFRPFILFRGLFSLSSGMGAGLGAAHLVQMLQVKAATAALFQAIGMLCSLYSMRLWGRLLDKFGCRSILMFGGGIMGVWYISWLFVQPGTWWVAGVFYLMFFFQSSLPLGFFTFAARLSPVEGRPAYLTAQSFVSHLLRAVGPLIGWQIAGWTEGMSFNLGFGHMNNLQFVLLIAGVVRLASLPILLKVEEPKGRSLGRMLQIMRNHSALRPSRNLYDFLEFWFAPIFAAGKGVARGAGKIAGVVQDRMESFRSTEDEEQEP